MVYACPCFEILIEESLGLEEYGWRWYAIMLMVHHYLLD